MSNIVLVADTFYPNIGGSETVLYQVTRYLVSKGHRVTVFTPESETGSAGEIPGLQIHRSAAWLKLQKLGASKHPLVNRLGRALIYLLLPAWIGGVKSDVLVAGHLLPAGLVAKWLKFIKRCSCTIVITYGEEVSMYRRGGRMLDVMKSALKDADALTCLTASSREELEEILPGASAKTTVIPPAVPESHGDANSAHILTGRPILFTACRLVPRKGVDTTIEAIALLGDEFPTLRYYISGVGPDVDRLQALVSDRGLTSQVTFLGLAPSLVPYFRQCDIFCMPNRTMENGEREGFGIVFLEAGREGKPSIAGNSGGAPEAVLHERTGLIVQPDDPVAMAQAIRRLASDEEERLKFGAAAIAHAGQFSEKALGERFEQVITDALNSSMKRTRIG